MLTINRFRYIFRLLAVLLAALAAGIGIGGCSAADEPEDAADATTPGTETLLRIKVSINNPLSGTPTRAPQGDYDFELPESRYELIRTLRVIVVSDNSGTVEVNSFYDFGDDLSETPAYTYTVQANDLKHVYLLANVSDDDALVAGGITLSSLTKGSAFPAAVDDAMLRLTDALLVADNSATDSPRYIPMSETFDYHIGDPLDNDAPYEAEFFVTRAATKFSFEIDPASTLSGDFEVTRITFSDVADRISLFPRDAEYFPEKYTPSTEKYEGRVITSFSMPEGFTACDIVFEPADLKWTAADKNAPSRCWSPALYFPEMLAASGGKGFTVTIEGKGVAMDGLDHPEVDEGAAGSVASQKVTLGPVALDNLPNLPRNTHVVVRIKLSDLQPAIKVDVLPYQSVVLKPNFGLDIK